MTISGDGLSVRTQIKSVALLCFVLATAIFGQKNA
jgi:hypothetical protein